MLTPGRYVGAAAIEDDGIPFETKMTENLNLPEKLTAQPDDVAREIYKAQQKMKNVLYTKGVWRWLMLIIKVIPEWMFKRINLSN